jgi:hypothetical protein
MTTPDLRPSGPQSPDRTKELGNTLGEVTTALAYATARGRGGLEYAGDVYDLLANLYLALDKLPGIADSASAFLRSENGRGRLVRDDGADAAGDVLHAVDCLGDAKRGARALAEALRLAQSALSHVATRTGEED